ncbi:Yip1 family protein [Actinacidiphila bryophytorum]|uniref:Yip1 family protein n=1 Tax=Actinacidiphila bryophytorum TaxID=1436133 RepID=UPI00195F8542|nr:Yip1 family protein [Actinacidiphila bryophytorum]MBM9435909.1 YIP1 family protein [Actinacidiphila bryophytorum]MBN6547352.1 YIP1 family protein [Actinacidiphila bryophytorum]
MSQVGSKAAPRTGRPAPGRRAAGTFEGVAGFENRRGQDQNAPGGYPPGHGPYAPSGSGGQSPYGGPYDPSYDAPGPYDGRQPYGQPPAYDDAPGHTRAFTMGEPAPLADPYAYAEDNVATYRAGQSAAPPAGPRLHWKPLLSGILLRPGRTFWQMRDHTMWGPALTVTFLYGLLAVFGFDAARKDVLDATLTASVPWVVTTGIAVTLCGLTLGAVTNTLARQLGGDGAWAPTIGLAMLITSLTDAPRLFFALFLGGGNGFVQLLGWLTWLACAALMTSMVGKSHDLPWHKALGASSIQLVALLMLFKLPLI